MLNPVSAYYQPRRRRVRGERVDPPRTPAGRIVRLLGGPAKVAAFTGRSVSIVYRWLAPKADGGTGGRVPYGVQEALIRAAAERGIVLSHADFTPKTGEAFL